MASLFRVRDNHRWLVDREILDIAATVALMGENGVIHSVDFELPPAGAQISHVIKEGGVVEGHFYIIHLDSGLRFPLPKFIRGVLANFDIAPSLLLPNF